MQDQIIDATQLLPWSDPEEVSKSILSGSIVSSDAATTIEQQVSYLQGIVIEPPRYRLSDLALDNNIVNFTARVSNAENLAVTRISELASLTEELDKFLATVHLFQTCAFSFSAAREGLSKAAAVNGISITQGDKLDEVMHELGGLFKLLQARSREAIRVSSEMARKASDISLFVEESVTVVSIYSTVIERQREVLAAQLLQNPDPLLEEELRLINEGTEKVIALQNELLTSNQKTRQNVQKIKDDHQRRLERLNPLKVLENITNAIGGGLGALGEGLGDLGREINIGWNNAKRETWIGLDNVFREFTIGICRLQHGSPDKDKDGNGDGKNAGFYKCMDEGWQASVTVNGDGEVTGIAVDPPGIPIPIQISLITDADREAEKRRVTERAAAIMNFNTAVRERFQPGEDVEFNADFFDQLRANPDHFFKPFGTTTLPLLDREVGDAEPYQDKGGTIWPSKNAYKAALTELHITRIDEGLHAIENDLISTDFVNLGTFFFASLAIYETAADLVAPFASGAASGAMMVFAVTKDLASGDDVSFRVLVTAANIPLFNTFEAWMMLQTWTTESASAQKSQFETKRMLEAQKKLLEDNLKDLQEIVTP